MEEFVHASGVPCDELWQRASLLFIQVVAVRDGAQPRRVDDGITFRGQRDEAVCGIRQVPQARAGTRYVPVDEDPALRTVVLDVAYQVPGCQVVMADQLVAVRRDDYVPRGVG